MAGILTDDWAPDPAWGVERPLVVSPGFIKRCAATLGMSEKEACAAFNLIATSMIQATEYGEAETLRLAGVDCFLIRKAEEHGPGFWVHPAPRKRARRATDTPRTVSGEPIRAERPEDPA